MITAPKKWRRWLPAFFLPLSLTASGFTPARTEPGYRVIESDARGMTLEVEIPDYRLVDAEKDDTPCRRVMIPGYVNRPESGGPSLPEKLLQVPLPGVAGIQARVHLPPPKLSEELKLCPPPARRYPGHETEALRDNRILSDSRIELTPRLKKLLEIRARMRESSPPPEPIRTFTEDSPPALVGKPVWLRNRQFINILIRPLRYLEEENRLEYFPRIRVEIIYEEKIVSPSLRKIKGADYGAQFALAAAGAFKTGVRADGVYEVTYADLQAAGFDLGGDPRNLKMYFLGDEISISVHGEDDGTWNPGDYLRFYGQANTGFYSQTNIYWILQSTIPGLRMRAAASDRAGSERPCPCFVAATVRTTPSGPTSP